MADDVEIRPLAREDDRSQFSSGQAEIDRFFREYAGQNQFKLHLSVTYVAVLRRSLVGFATVTAGVLERSGLPTVRLRKRLPAYPLPVLRLARLGVDRSAQGRGLGLELVHHVLGLALAQRDSLGGLGVVADAKPDAVPFYARLGFVPLTVTEGAIHGQPTPMFLSIETIAEALER